jgi:hypothetical protein
MSRRAINVIAALAMAATVIGCSASTASRAGSTSQQQAGSTSQQQAGSTSQQQAGSTSQQASAVDACSVLTNAQVGSEFGATFGDAQVFSPQQLSDYQLQRSVYESAVASSGCSFQLITTVKPWAFSVVVSSFPTEAAATTAMVYFRKTTDDLSGATSPAIEEPGVGDDAVLHSLSLTEELVVRKGSVVYEFGVMMITGISGSATIGSHMVNLAKGYFNR